MVRYKVSRLSGFPSLGRCSLRLSPNSQIPANQHCNTRQLQNKALLQDQFAGTSSDCSIWCPTTTSENMADSAIRDARRRKAERAKIEAELFAFSAGVPLDEDGAFLNRDPELEVHYGKGPTEHEGVSLKDCKYPPSASKILSNELGGAN